MTKKEITSLKANGRTIMLTKFMDNVKSFALARALIAINKD